MTSEEHKKKLKDKYRYWFESNGYQVLWDSMEYILKHVRVYAKDPQTGDVESFFMTEKDLKQRVGFGKSHKTIHYDAHYRPDKIERMREIIDEAI